MSLYDDVILPEFGATGFQTNNNNIANSKNNSSKNENQNDLAASNWNTSSLKLLQYQVEAVKKRQMTLNSSTNLRREKPSTNIAPVIDLSEKKKPQLQLKKEIEYLTPQPPATANELRFNSLTGKIEKEDSSLFASLNEEYDPMKPNDYEKVILELRRNSQESSKKSKHSDSDEDYRRRRRSRSRSRSRSRDKHRRRSRDRKRSGRHSSSSSEDDSKRKRKNEEESTATNKRNNLFAPPPSLLESDSKSILTDQVDEVKPALPKLSTGGLFKAEKMMAKMGYKEGEGLGRNNQGMAMALQVEKTGKRSGRIIHEKDVVETPAPPAPVMIQPPINSPVTISKEPTTQVGIPNEVMKNMSKVILLRNMVQPGEVDDDLEGETKEECQKYGEVVKCVIFEIPNKPKDEAVRIFIEFKTLPSAIKALTDLNGRFFGGRVVKATFYNLDKFKRLELADEV